MSAPDKREAAGATSDWIRGTEAGELLPFSFSLLCAWRVYFYLWRKGVVCPCGVRRVFCAMELY